MTDKVSYRVDFCNLKPAIHIHLETICNEQPAIKSCLSFSAIISSPFPSDVSLFEQTRYYIFLNIYNVSPLQMSLSPRVYQNNFG